jgi:hypothetical protein
MDQDVRKGSDAQIQKSDDDQLAGNDATFKEYVCRRPPIDE